MGQINIRDVKLEKCRRFFWEYLKVKDPEFYYDERWHLKEFAEILQKFWERKLRTPSGKIAKILIINLPPRMGKSYTLTNFCAWVLGKSKMDKDRRTEQIITVSYNDDMATDFSRYCRDNISNERNEPDEIVFGDIFYTRGHNGVKIPVSIGKGDGAAKKWALKGEFFNYLGAGFKGQITGKGASIGLIDDPVKNRDEAYNEKTLDYIWEFYKNTFRSRIENNGLQIINHTRWRNEDLAGRIMDMYGDDVYVHKRAIISDVEYEIVEYYDEYDNFLYEAKEVVSGEMLCDSLCSFENFKDLETAIDNDILLANYFQETLDEQGRLYKTILTYDMRMMTDGKFDGLPIKNYTDTADEGDDYLCSICYVEIAGQAYIIDVLYTIEGMEDTEPACAEMLYNIGCNLAKIESNSGGRGFARAVARILMSDYNSNKCVIDWFSQSKNKKARINSQSAWVQKNIFFPENWHMRWPEFYKAVTGYQKEGNNAHDDAPDCLTGIAEQFQHTGGMPIFNPKTRPNNVKGFALWQQR